MSHQNLKEIRHNARGDPPLCPEQKQCAKGKTHLFSFYNDVLGLGFKILAFPFLESRMHLIF